MGFFVLSFALYAFYQSEAEGSDELQRLGTTDPVIQPDPVPSIPEPSSTNANQIPVPDPVEVPAPEDVQAPVVNEPTQETNSSN